MQSINASHSDRTSVINLIQLHQIRLDGGTQFRDYVDQDVVKHYEQAMLDGAEFPAMQCTFDGTHYWLWDGFHRYFAIKSIGIKQAEVEYKPGTQEDAQDLALSANARHGHNRNNATKRKQVETALSMPRHANKSDREIAKLCEVSGSFVASIRNPEVKEKQAKKVAKHFEKKANEESAVKLHPDAKLTHTDADQRPPMTQDFGPSDEELAANERAIQADLEAMNKFLEADDKMAQLAEENKRLRHMNESLQMRINSLMVEKNEAIRDAKKAQRQVDKLIKNKR